MERRPEWSAANGGAPGRGVGPKSWPSRPQAPVVTTATPKASAKRLGPRATALLSTARARRASELLPCAMHRAPVLNPQDNAQADGQLPSQVPAAGLSLSEAGPLRHRAGDRRRPRAPSRVTQAPPTYSSHLSAPSPGCGVCSSAERSHVEGGGERMLLLGRKHKAASQKDDVQGHCSSHWFIILDQPPLVSTAPSLHILTGPRRSGGNASSLAETSPRPRPLGHRTCPALASSCP